MKRRRMIPGGGGGGKYTQGPEGSLWGQGGFIMSVWGPKVPPSAEIPNKPSVFLLQCLSVLTTTVFHYRCPIPLLELCSKSGSFLMGSAQTGLEYNALLFM